MEPGEYHAMRAAEDRHWWYAGLHDLVLRVVCREAKRTGHSPDILDAGCGTGRLCELLQPFGTVTGCDMQPLALEAAAGRGLRSLKQRDLAADDLGTASYDIITCMDVLYHRAVADERTVLEKFRRALKPGGLLILQVAAFESLRGAHDEAVHTRRRYRRAEIVGLLERAEFTVEFASCRLLAWFLPALLWRCYTRRFPARDAGGKLRSDVAAPPAPWLNHLLTACVKLENRLLCAGFRLPLGTSVFALARK
jgi:SAM-dependent methyltransferase